MRYLLQNLGHNQVWKQRYALLSLGVVIVTMRESSVWLMQQFGRGAFGNLFGLVLLLSVLLILRRYRVLPVAWVDANNLIMRESAFAFLPIAAGAFVATWALGREIWTVLFILVMSTLIPLWIYARLAQFGLKQR